jgi:hypothetical protein
LFPLETRINLGGTANLCSRGGKYGGKLNSPYHFPSQDSDAIH